MNTISKYYNLRRAATIFSSLTVGGMTVNCEKPRPAVIQVSLSNIVISGASLQRAFEKANVDSCARSDETFDYTKNLLKQEPNLLKHVAIEYLKDVPEYEKLNLLQRTYAQKALAGALTKELENKSLKDLLGSSFIEHNKFCSTIDKELPLLGDLTRGSIFPYKIDLQTPKTIAEEIMKTAQTLKLPIEIVKEAKGKLEILKSLELKIKINPAKEDCKCLSLVDIKSPTIKFHLRLGAKGLGDGNYLDLNFLAKKENLVIDLGAGIKAKVESVKVDDENKLNIRGEIGLSDEKALACGGNVRDLVVKYRDASGEFEIGRSNGALTIKKEVEKKKEEIKKETETKDTFRTLPCNTEEIKRAPENKKCSHAVENTRTGERQVFYIDLITKKKCPPGMKCRF